MTLNHVYIAAPYAARDKVREMAKDLTVMLLDVTSSWLDEDHEINDGTVDAATDLTDDQVASHALQDLQDITESDLVILLTPSVVGAASTSGGRHVETGYAISLDIPVLVVGEPENVFHRLGPTHHVFVAPDWPTALQRIATALAWNPSTPLAEAFAGGPFVMVREHTEGPA